MDENEVEQLLTMTYKILGDPLIAETIAAMYWNIYSGLCKKGFSDNEALQIIINMSPGGKK